MSEKTPGQPAPENGNKEKWLEELVSNETRQYLLNYVKKYIKEGSLEDAEDVVQKTIIKATDAIKAGRFKYGSDLKPWLYTIARNTAISLLSQRRVRFNTKSLEEKFEQNKFEPSSPGLTDQERAMLQKDFKFYLNQLTPGARKVMELVAEGYDYKEIAERLNLHPITVGSRINRARKALDELIDKEERKTKRKINFANKKAPL